jgi:hypothetical protein
MGIFPWNHLLLSLSPTYPNWRSPISSNECICNVGGGEICSYYYLYRPVGFRSMDLLFNCRKALVIIVEESFI